MYLCHAVTAISFLKIRKEKQSVPHRVLKGLSMKVRKNKQNHKHYSQQITLFLTVLCAIHCMLTPILLVLLPVAGSYFEQYHWVEYVIIASVFFIGTSAVLHGYKDHHQNKLPVYVFIGGLVLLSAGSIMKIVFNVNDMSEHFLSGMGGITCGLGQLYNLKLSK
jgi:hypothetical protein